MSESKIGRRGFLGKTAAVSAGTALGISHEERALLAYAEEKPAKKKKAAADKIFPTGKIGDLTISRMICGGNLLSGHAHSRDLIYVSSLLKNYFTDEKIFETFEKSEERGIDTAIVRLDDHTKRVMSRYWEEQGGEIQWIAQIKPKADDLLTDIDIAIERGAVGAYVQGQVGDTFVEEGKVELIGEAVEHMKKSGIIGGIGGHALKTIVACEEAGLQPDFYMKTINSKSYWSAGPEPRHDSVWAERPEETIEFMKSVDKPWIAFKILGAGAIEPEEGFKYAFENGADFICVGMFDFQVAEDVLIAKRTLAAEMNRTRPWRA